VTYGNFHTLPRPTADPVAARMNASLDDQSPRPPVWLAGAELDCVMCCSSCAFGGRNYELCAPDSRFRAVGAGFCQHWPHDASAELLFRCCGAGPFPAQHVVI